MHPSRTEPTSGRLTLEIGRWSASVFSIAATIVFVLVVFMLAKSTLTNNARADDWQQRAIAAEEIVGGLRLVIAERSKALNERTVQANSLAANFDTRGRALRTSKSSLGRLTRNQRQLATEKAALEKEHAKLQRQHGDLVSAASELNACSNSLEPVVRGRKTTAATRRARLSRCGQAQASFRAWVESAG